MGLGSLQSGVGLTQARVARDEARRILQSGRNPIEERRQTRRAAVKRPTFGQIADALFEAKAPEWRNQKHREQWQQSLTAGAAALRNRPVDEIDTEAILGVLKPLWTVKPETASRLRGRIEAVLAAAKAQGHRKGENPAAWRGHLSHLLPKRSKLKRGHHAAMAYWDIPRLMTKLGSDPTVAARALRVCVLTATRSAEILGAQWSEVDFGAKIWTIPPTRMKGAREHRVPLANQVSSILEALLKMRTGDFVFESPRGKRPLSHVAMAKVLGRYGIQGATVHGFRSSFRDWAGNETHFAREVAEAALAHLVGDKSEQAYRRSDALEKRRQLMAAWACHCMQESNSENVIHIGHSASA